MKIIIILGVIFSLLNDFIVRNMPSLSNITSVFIIVFIFLSIIYLIKKKQIKQYKVFYLILYINIAFILIQILFIGINPYMVKLMIYITTVFLLINYLDKLTLSSLYKVIIIISIILSLDIIIQSMFLFLKGINLRNLRYYTLLDKQGYNMFYSFSIPIMIIYIYIYKKVKIKLYLALNLIAAIFMMQIKSLLYTIPLGIIIGLIALNMINVKKVVKITAFIVVCVTLTLVIFPKLIPRQISVPINYYIFNDLKNINNDDLRDLDTFIIRREIWEKGIEIVKKHPIIGIGYGNYPNYVKDINITSKVTGITYELPNVTESGVLTFLTEGGIVGGILHFSIVAWITIKTKKIIKRSEVEIITTIIFFVFIISNIVQDNLNYLYWFVIAAQVYNIGNQNDIRSIEK